MKNKAAMIYTEWLPLIGSLEDSIAGVIFKNILAYQNGDEIISNNPVWLFIKSKLDEFNEKYSNIVETRRNIGKIGGLAKASKSYQKLASVSKCSNKTKQNKINIKENNIYTSTFETLWSDFQAYGVLKGSKQDAWKEYEKIVRDTDHVKVYDGIMAYSRWCVANRKYTKAVEQALKKRVWEEDYTQVQTKNVWEA